MTNLVKRYGLIGIAIVFLAAAIVGWTQLRNPHEELGHIEVFGNVDVRQVNLGFKVRCCIEGRHWKIEPVPEHV